MNVYIYSHPSEKELFKEGEYFLCVTFTCLKIISLSCTHFMSSLKQGGEKFLFSQICIMTNLEITQTPKISKIKVNLL